MRLTIALAAALLCLAPGHATRADDRTAWSSDAPDWLRAVGRLTVPGYEYVDGEQRHREENCSATLVGRNTVLTAWHCFEFYNDLSKDPVFVLPHAPLQPPVIARRLTDGGGMSADWALLRLEKPVVSVDPMPVRRFSGNASPARLVLAGFARDVSLGQGGRVLTWEGGCRQTANEHYRVGTDCVTFKGASGGAVVAGDQLIGVISSGDGAEITYFAPSSLFMVNLHLHRR